MDVRERVAIKTALGKFVKESLDADKAELKEQMAGFDSEKVPLKVSGQKVGTATMVPGRVKATVTDTRTFLEWCLENGAVPNVTVPIDWYKDGSWLTADGANLVTRDGEVVPGVFVEEGEPYLMVRDCKLEAVRPLLGAGAVDALLLEG